MNLFVIYYYYRDTIIIIQIKGELLQYIKPAAHDAFFSLLAGFRTESRGGNRVNFNGLKQRHCLFHLVNLCRVSVMEHALFTVLEVWSICVLTVHKIKSCHVSP